MQNIINFFQENIAARIILDAYLTLLIVSFLIFLAFKIKKVFILLIIGIFLGIFSYFSQVLAGGDDPIDFMSIVEAMQQAADIAFKQANSKVK